MIKALIFDFDGTLVDSSEGIFYTARKVMENLGFKTDKTDEEMRGFVGPMLPDCFRQVFHLEEKYIENAVEEYRRIYKEKGFKMLHYYDGASRVLEKAKEKGIKLAIATNKNQSVIDDCISYLECENLFDAVVGTDNKEKKNKSQALGAALLALGVKNEEALMVGDTYGDLEGAKNNNVPFLGVLWGFGFRRKDNLENVIESFDEIEKLILSEEKMIEKIETSKAPKAIGPYSQGVKFKDLVFLSGQIPIIPETGLIKEGTAAEQAEQVFLNIKEVLKEAGTDLSKVIKATVFLSDMNDFNSVNTVYASFFSSSRVLPARSAVEVSRLPKDVKVEIEVIATI